VISDSDLTIILYIALGSAAGGFVNGLAGFGTALFALGFFLTVLDPPQAVAVVVSLSVLTSLPGLWLVRHAIFANQRRLARFLIPALAGIPIGVSILSVIDPQTLKLTIAGFLILYGGFFSLRRALPRFVRPTPVADAGVGFIGGVLGGAASLSGALPTMWCSMRPWPKAETRAVLQPYNFAVLGLTAGALLFGGAFTRETWLPLMVALPVSLAASQIGIAVFKRLPDDAFRRLLIALTLVSGLALMARELLL
jgi:uncharacterized membrane protein YfcA